MLHRPERRARRARDDPDGQGRRLIENSPAAWSARATLPTSHESALWSPRGQHDRFAAVVAVLEPGAGESLLDYGCGTGALSAFLPDDVEYVGYDWAEGMRARARRDHHAATIVDELPDRRFDLVAAIGPFNLRDHWTKELTWATLRMLWARTRRALAVSLYAGDDPDCLPYTEDDLETFDAPGMSRRVVDRHRPNDLLLVLHR